jgi:dihydrofolate synthase/folylpolyglutamate synthase
VTATEWVASLERFGMELGLGRMRELLAALGDPQLAYPSIHVVGTNGKSTTTRTGEALLRREGLRVGAYLSPHVTGWAERIRICGAEADFERAVARVRPAAERVGATQFETLTAAALAAFGEAGVDAAVVEAGLGGRYDATNVLRSPVQALTNVALDHTEHLGETREQIAEEKLAVVQPGATVVVGEGEWEGAAYRHGAAKVVVAPDGNARVALEAVSAFVGHRVEPIEEVRPHGRLELRGRRPLEIWDGAHNPAGLRYLLDRLDRCDHVAVVSILRDKEPERMLADLAAHAPRLVATTSSNRRALTAPELARAALDLDPAGPRFAAVEAVDDPAEALARARVLAGVEGAVLVTGSLYLLADLYARMGMWQHAGSAAEA